VDAKERERLLDDVLDPNKVILYCQEHGYFGPLKPSKLFLATPSKEIRTAPMPGCQKCWQVYFMQEIGRAAPHEREKLLEELERAVHDAAALEDAGLFDFVVNRRPEFTIEKGD
jgi:hypothetical protein